VFGVVCPERGAGAALVLPACNNEAMQLHLDKIATKVTPGAQAIVLLDQAGWHGAKILKVPSNISLILNYWIFRNASAKSSRTSGSTRSFFAEFWQSIESRLPPLSAASKSELICISA
jgi:hypothetical protein